MWSVTVPRSAPRRAAVAAVLLVATSSCAASVPVPGPAPSASAAASSGPSSSAAPSGASVTTVSCDTGQWRAAPISFSRHVAVPPVAIITGVRTATHPGCGYDRLVLDLTGTVRGYQIRYVTRVAADPSGKPIRVPGHSYLLITLQAAQAHADSGAATVPAHAAALGYPMLTGYALTGDFEGVVTFALGLKTATSIRVGELPGRWYIDVRS